MLKYNRGDKMSDYMNKLTTKQLKELEEDINIIYSKATKKVLKQIRSLLADLENGLEGVERLNAVNKLNRLEGILERIMEDIHNSNLETVKQINKHIIDTFINNQEYGAFLVENAAGVELKWSLYSRDTIKEILTGDSNPFYQLALDNFKDKDLIYRSLKRELTQGIILGESMNTISKRIQKVIGTNNYDSIRIARTETTRSENAGRLNSFKQAEKEGLELKKQWLSTVDSRTRESHLNMNLEAVALNDNFSNGLDHPGGNGKASEVINCRCSMSVELLGFEKTEKEKELDQELKRMNFEEWKKRRL